MNLMVESCRMISAPPGSFIVVTPPCKDWRAIRDRGGLVAIVSMDLSKAFDVIQYPTSSLQAYSLRKERYKLRFTEEVSHRQISELRSGAICSSWAEKRQAWCPAGECLRINAF